MLHAPSVPSRFHLFNTTFGDTVCWRRTNLVMHHFLPQSRLGVFLDKPSSESDSSWAKAIIVFARSPFVRLFCTGRFAHQQSLTQKSMVACKTMRGQAINCSMANSQLPISRAQLQTARFKAGYQCATNCCRFTPFWQVLFSLFWFLRLFQNLCDQAHQLRWVCACAHYSHGQRALVWRECWHKDRAFLQS